MARTVLPVNWHLHTARQIIESVSEASNTAYYVWVGVHNSSNGGGIPDIFDRVKDVSIDAYRNMIYGKRVSANDARLMIRNVPYSANVVYSMYDDEDLQLEGKDFFVAVNDGSWHHVFKCLDNNNGQPSTASPNFNDVNISDEVYQTSDGYRWKYMSSVSSTDIGRFGSVEYIPLVLSSAVSAAAKSGSIDIIKVTEKGQGYNNHLSGKFVISDVNVGGNTLIHSVSQNTSASPSNGYYTGCMIHLTEGAGVGQYREIVDYYVTDAGRYIVLDSEFSVNPTGTTNWSISPAVKIQGTGAETVKAAARAIVNSVGNTIHRVEVLSRGADYDYATAKVIANSAVNVIKTATVRPINPPPGGHGFDAAAELGARRVSISVPFVGSESNTIPTTNGFRQIGIMKDPVFANVVVGMSSTNGVFTKGEKVHSFTRLRLQDAITTNASINQISSNNAKFDEKLSSGDWVYLKSVEDNVHQLTTVGTVINSSHVNLAVNAGFSCTAVVLYKATLYANGTVSADAGGPNVTLTDVRGVFSTGNEVIGNTSGAWGTVSTIYRNGVAKGFNTFVQMHKYVGTYNSGSFTQDEKVFQGNSLSTSTANASLHSAVTVDGSVIVYTSNQVGDFATDQPLKGANSGAILTISDKYKPELAFASGEIVYVENVNMVDRHPDQTESINVMLEF